MQGNDPKYVKTVTTVKHFVANNVEHDRERIFSNINKKDLYEYYFPAYKTCIVDEEATGVITSYSIHYTKLYECRPDSPASCMPSAGSRTR